ncbi:MAG: galactose oxidase-like domain-containing protein, partial [Ardenticatenaceae bacterium]
LTVLPTGQVLVTSGSQGTEPNTTPVYAAELWNPGTETWATLAAAQMARTYHGTGLLLPDGRVLVAGSGGCCGAPDQYNAEIFSPPYLFAGARPQIDAAPTEIGYGSPFVVETGEAASIARVALIRPAAVTHTTNMEQRYVPLAFTPSGNTLTVTAPAQGNIAPPGYYMLFIVDANGVPSVAAWVRLS